MNVTGVPSENLNNVYFIIGSTFTSIFVRILIIESKSTI